MPGLWIVLALCGIVAAAGAGCLNSDKSIAAVTATGVRVSYREPQYMFDTDRALPLMAPVFMM